MELPSSLEAREERLARGDMQVDVGIPAFRRARFLSASIESVLAQTFGLWRLTIFDNGVSGGEIEQVVQQYLADPRIFYLASGSELSLGENWTNVINHGRAPYVALLPDDDRWHPEFLEARVHALDAHPQCGFAFAECLVTDEEGTTIDRGPYRFPSGVLSREVLARSFTRQNAVVPSAILVRRSAYEAVGPRFDGSWHYCDWEMWARLAASFPAYYLTRRDNEFRRQASANTFAKAESPERLLEMIAHIEHLFERELGDLEEPRATRARNRSRILLNAAADVHSAAGWSASGALYRRALRVYPPTVFTYASLSMLAHTLLGRRGSRLAARLLRVFRKGDPVPSEPRG